MSTDYYLLDELLTDDARAVRNRAPSSSPTSSR